MPFSSYKNLAEVLKEFNVKYQEEDYLVPRPLTVSDQIRAELQFNLTEMVTDNSEQAICEMVIYPILREVWKHYKEYFMLWSHQPLKYDDSLAGVPDYTLATRSPLGKIVFEKPYFVVVEAKKDNFTEGWGQCLAELIAIQKLNDNPQQVVFGIVTNGERWEFGKLQASLLVKNIKGYNIEDLDSIFAIINQVFEQCRQQLTQTSILTESQKSQVGVV